MKLQLPIQNIQQNKLFYRSHDKNNQPYKNQRRHSQRGKTDVLIPIQKYTQKAFRPIKITNHQEIHQSKNPNFHMPVVDLYHLKNAMPKKNRQITQYKSSKKKIATNRMLTQKLSQRNGVSGQKNKKSMQKVIIKGGYNKRNSPNALEIGVGKLQLLNKIIDHTKQKKNLKHYENRITAYEKEQSEKYEIYYTGSRRIYSKSDFTDTQGDAKVMIGDSIAYRYEITQVLGRGSFGRVFKVFDHKKKQYAALKIIKSQQKFMKQAKIEVQILQTALLHDPKLKCNIVKLKSSFQFRTHSCITFEVLHKNLYEFLKQTNFAGFPLDLIRRFAIQILQSLLFLQQFKIVHCDLKPENILLKEQNKSGIKIIDVGSGCFQSKQIYTYIQSRFYRAPEIILGIKYTCAIDMWSFGCIIAELFSGYPIFPGESEDQQIQVFIEMIGNPPKSMLEIAERRKKFFNDQFQCKIPNISKSLSFRQVIGDADQQFLHLVGLCLEWDPQKRITPKQALLHPWILNGLPPTIRTQHIEQLNS